jgi:hypothetical protein
VRHEASADQQENAQHGLDGVSPGGADGLLLRCVMVLGHEDRTGYTGISGEEFRAAVQSVILYSDGRRWPLLGYGR